MPIKYKKGTEKIKKIKTIIGIKKIVSNDLFKILLK